MESEKELAATPTSLARELAELEGVEHLFDSMVKDIIEASRAASTQRMLGAPGRTPSVIAQQVQTLESALDKIDHNLRSQYADFLSAYISAREKLFTNEQIQAFVITLRQGDVQDYLMAMRQCNKELLTPVGDVLKKAIQRATTSGTAPTSHADPSAN